MASAAVTSKRTKSKTANRNYSANLADGRSVTVKNGVKTYSDKPLQVKGKNGISISGKEYSRDKGGTGYAPITSEAIKPTEQIELPTKPKLDNLTTLTDSINTALATGSGGAYTYEPGKGLVTTPPTTTAEPTTAMSNFNQMMQALGTNFETNSFDAEANTRAMQKEIRPYEKAVSNYQNQLNQIVAKRDADQLSLEGQGRGITETIIGGQQAKIGREAAIQALPIQAQLAAAQDDLESARTYVSQLYTAKQADAQARYQYEASKITAIYGFLTAEEAKVARAKELEQSRAYQVEDRNLSLASNLAQTAMEFGQSSLAGKIMALNEKSPTFQADLAALQAQVQKPVAPAAPKAPTTQLVDGNLYQYDYGTGQWNLAVAGGDGKGGTMSAAEQSQVIADELSSKIANIASLKTHSGLNSAVGPVGLFRVGMADAFSGAKDEFIGKVEQLVSKEFLDTLISTKAKGATFGALTKPEQDALTASATAIGQWRNTDKNGKATGYDIDEKSFRRELDNLITLAQKAESRARGYDVTLVPSYDSMVIDSLTKDYRSAVLLQDPSNFYK